jgi:arsenate reductase
VQFASARCNTVGLLEAKQAAVHHDAQFIDQMLARPLPISRAIVITPWGVKLCRPSELVLDLLPLPQRGHFAKEDGELLIDAQGRRIPSTLQRS